jgi:hypothetical protein
MSHFLPPSPGRWTRRQVIQGLGAGALGPLFGGCAAPPQAPPRPVDRALAPRVGDTWRYQYTSAWRNVPPRMLEVRVLEVTGENVRDRMSAEGDPAADDRSFNYELALVGRPLSGLLVHEFAPYLPVFGGLPPGGSFAVSLPTPSWGSQWTTTATLRGPERLTLPAGSFDTTRVDIYGQRFFIRGQMDDAIDPVKLYSTVWYAQSAKRVVQASRYTQAAGLNILERDQYQLVAQKLG